MIRPALAAGQIVVSDRYLLANVVYQGHAGGLPVAAVKQVGEVAIDGVQPECIFVLDMPPEAADRRMQRTLDRMESQGEEYRRRLRDGYLAEAAADPRIHVVDAAGSIETVHTAIWQIAQPLLGR